MYGMWLGIPLGFVVFLAGIKFLPDYFHQMILGTALAACGAYAIYYACRGIDVLNERKLDNPLPFNAPEAMPLAFGKINELLKENNYGPFGWQIKNVDTDEMRIVALLKFTEISGGFFEQGRVQLERLLLLNVQCEQVDMVDNLEPTKKIPGTKIQLTWRVDSPVHRHSVNSIIKDLTAAIQHVVGVKEIEQVSPPHPMMPPVWVQTTAACLLAAGLMNHDDVEKQIAARQKAMEEQRQQQETARAQREQERQDQINAYKQRMEEQRKQWEQQQQQPTPQQSFAPQTGTGVSPYNPFTPSLEPGLNGGSLQQNNSPIYTPAPTFSSPWKQVAPALGGAGAPTSDNGTVNNSAVGSNGQRWRAGQ